ncbi:hypothetical protein V8E54_001442 [Elaphomyces granulatus]
MGPSFQKFGRLVSEYAVNIFSRTEDEHLDYLHRGWWLQVVSIDETADHTIRELFHYKIPASFMGSHAWCSDQVHTITGQASLWRSSLQTSQNRLSGTSRNRRTTHTMIQPDSTSSRPCHPCKLRRGLLLKAGTATSRIWNFRPILPDHTNHWVIARCSSPTSTPSEDHTCDGYKLCRCVTNVLSTSVVALRQASRTYVTSTTESPNSCEEGILSLSFFDAVAPLFRTSNIDQISVKVWECKRCRECFRWRREVNEDKPNGWRIHGSWHQIERAHHRRAYV